MVSLEEVMGRLGQRFEARRRTTAWNYRNIGKIGKGDPGARRPTPGPALARRQGDEPGGDAAVDPMWSPLFRRRSGNRRAYLEGVPLRLPNIGSVTYHGQELRDDDRAVWLQIVGHVNRRPRSPWIACPAGSMLRAMGWGISAFSRQRLRECLERMQATVLWFAGGQSRTTIPGVSLIEKCEWLPSKTGKSGHWRIWIDPEIRALMVGSATAEIEVRQPVTVLADRLQRLFQGHAKPYPRRVDTLWRQCGMETKTEGAFRHHLGRALDRLKKAGFLADYRIDEGDLVHVTRA